MSLTAAEPEKQITKLTKAEVIFFMTNKKIYCVSHSYLTKKSLRLIIINKGVSLAQQFAGVSLNLASSCDNKL